MTDPPVSAGRISAKLGSVTAEMVGRIYICLLPSSTKRHKRNRGGPQGDGPAQRPVRRCLHVAWHYLSRSRSDGRSGPRVSVRPRQREPAAIGERKRPNAAPSSGAEVLNGPRASAVARLSVDLGLGLCPKAVRHSPCSRHPRWPEAPSPYPASRRRGLWSRRYRQRDCRAWRR